MHRVFGFSRNKKFIIPFFLSLVYSGHYEKAGISPQECLIDENLGNKAVTGEEKYLIKVLEKINLDPQNLVALFGLEIISFFRLKNRFFNLVRLKHSLSNAPR